MPYSKLQKEEYPFKPKPLQLKKPVWELYRDGLTQASISLFLKCREQFRLSLEEGWTAKRTSAPIEFGSAFHHVLSKIQSPTQNKKALVTGPKEVSSILSRYVRKAKQEAKMSAQDSADFDLLMGQVQAVAESYLKFWEKEDKARNWLCRERAFNYKFGGKIPLRGRWDGLFTSQKKDNVIWLHETKTKGQIDDEGIKATLPFDIQTMLYCFAAQKVYDQPIGGTLYDVVRQPQLRQGKTESHKDFLARIQKDIADRPKWYFFRWEVKLSPQDVEQWQINQLQPILREIMEWNQDRTRHYMNPNQLFTQFRSRCDLFHAITSGNFYGLFRKKCPYPELID